MAIKWTEEKVGYLRKWREKDVIFEAIAKMMTLKFGERFTRMACEMKAYKLRIVHFNRAWTTVEHKLLTTLCNQKWPYKNIKKRLVEEFGNTYRVYTEATISQRIHKLGIANLWHKWTEEEKKHNKILKFLGFTVRERAKRMRRKFGRNFTYAMIESQNHKTI